jgi:hypothetical protein
MTNATTPNEKIIDLVRRCLALAKSANEHEAAAAAAKAQELLLKYNLNMAEVERDTNAEGIGRVDAKRANMFAWSDLLMGGIAKGNLCRIVLVGGIGRGDHGTFAIFGKREAIEVTQYMYAYLSAEIVRLTPKGRGFSYANAWRLGAATTISLRLSAELDGFKAATTASTALVVTNDAALTAAVARSMGKTGKKKAYVRSNSGFRDGRAAGEKIGIRAGLKTNAAGQSLLGR